jgi:hypothetical protein
MKSALKISGIGNFEFKSFEELRKFVNKELRLKLK